MLSFFSDVLVALVAVVLFLFVVVVRLPLIFFCYVVGVVAV